MVGADTKSSKEKTGKEDKDERSALEKELFVDKKSAWETLKGEVKEAFVLAKEYRKFIDNYKSQREIVAFGWIQAKRAGFTELSKATASTKKIYAKNHDKNMLLIDLGAGELSDGLRIIGGHIDTLRLDLKLSPVYEAEPSRCSTCTTTAA